jgi:hypothetical protein
MGVRTTGLGTGGVAASGRAGRYGGVAASGRAVLGTGGVAAVSPVVTTVAGEVTADVLMTSL